MRFIKFSKDEMKKVNLIGKPFSNALRGIGYAQILARKEEKRFWRLLAKVVPETKDRECQLDLPHNGVMVFDDEEDGKS